MMFLLRKRYWRSSIQNDLNEVAPTTEQANEKRDVILAHV